MLAAGVLLACASPSEPTLAPGTLSGAYRLTLTTAATGTQWTAVACTAFQVTMPTGPAQCVAGAFAGGGAFVRLSGDTLTLAGTVTDGTPTALYTITRWNGTTASGTAYGEGGSRGPSYSCGQFTCRDFERVTVRFQKQ